MQEYIDDAAELLDDEEERTDLKMKEANIKPVLKLDYTLKTMAERSAFVAQVIERTPEHQLTSHYLEILSDYIIDAAPKEDKRNHVVMTPNRMVTINKRETSYEGLASKFENGEDGLSNLFIEDNKHLILSPKIEITQEDIDTIPGLKELRDQIAIVEAASKQASGRKKYLLKKQLIEMRRDQYVLKTAFKPVTVAPSSVKGHHQIEISGEKWIDENGEPQSNELVSLFDAKHVSAILCNYALLKESLHGKFHSDFYYLIESFDKVLTAALLDYPLYQDLVKYKINGKQNLEIQELLYQTYGIKHSVEYISSLWRNKIPKLIAAQAQEDYLIWYYTHEAEGKWKKCSRCGQTKLAHSRFFSKNNTAKDGFYSICKRCRNKKE